MELKALVTFLSIIFLHSCVAPPVTKNKEQPNEQVDSDGLENYMEYHRYLREVVNTLESDPDFKRKLEKASEEDIRSGKIAYELEFVNHHIRTRLDEIKRTELERLKELTQKKRELIENNSVDDPTHHHLDHSNPHTFEIEDLKKLIAKTTQDLAEADRKRREEFKQYELQKEFEKQEKLNHTAGDERMKLEKEIKEMEEKHKKHEKLHEPGHKQQLEEVWEEQDHMQQDFDPKTFFMLHDLDSNGMWDQTEVKALFVKELDKMYAAGAPEDDMRERAEEMELMRESVFREIDTNKDGFIDYSEFIAQTKKSDFQQDHGWQGIDEQKPYTNEELEQYIRQHQVNTYRMLLRREQIHKVVLNQLITTDLDLQPMSSTDKAWCWGGYNYSEDDHSLEKLAAKFKNVEISKQFYDAVQNSIKANREYHSTQKLIPSTLEEYVGEDVSGDDERDTGEEVEGEEEEDLDYYEDDDEDERAVMFKERCTLREQISGEWKTIVSGVIIIFYDSEIYGTRISFYDDYNVLLSNTLIGVNTVMKIENNVCTWRAVEWANNIFQWKTLQAIFETEEIAERFHIIYQEGVSYAEQSGIIDNIPTFIDPE